MIGYQAAPMPLRCAGVEPGAWGTMVRILTEAGVVVDLCHLSEVWVSPGNRVQPGWTVGLSGNSGTRTTGPHLHLQVWPDLSATASGARRIDPAVALGWTLQ